MTALVPANCAISAQTAAKAALLRRIEACARANEDRQDAPRSFAKPTASARPAQPAAALAAHILGAREGAANPNGYGAYTKAARLLRLESHIVDITLG